MSKNTYLMIVILVSVITRVALTYRAVSDGGFMFTNLAVSAIVDSSGKIQDYPFVEGHNTMNQAGNLRSTRSLIVFLPVFLHQITGLPLYFLLFLPISGILIPVLGYILAGRLMELRILALTYALFLAVDPWFSSLTYQISTQGYGYIFYLLLILISLKFMRKDTFDRKYFLLLILFFTMTLLSYYVTEFYSASYILLLLFFSYLHKRGGDYSYKILKNTKPLRILFLVFMIIMTLCEPLFYSYSKNIFQGYGHNVFQTFLDYIGYIKNLTVSEGPTLIKYGSLFPLSVTFYIITILPIFYYLIVSLFSSKKPSPQTKLVFYSLFLTGAANVVGYIVVGGYVQIGYFHSIYPLLALIAIGELSCRIKKVQVSKIYSVGLLAIVALAFISFMRGPWVNDSLFRRTSSQRDFFWMSAHSNPEEFSVYLTSVEESGPLLFAYGAQGGYKHVVVYSYRSFESVQFLYSGLPEDLKHLKQTYSFEDESELKFIVISMDKIHEPLDGNNWALLPPLENISSLLDSPYVNSIFMGCRLILLKV